MAMKYPIGCVWCFPNAVYMNLKEPIVFRTSHPLASSNCIRGLELKSAATVLSFYNVSEIHSKEANTSLFPVQSMDKDIGSADGLFLEAKLSDMKTKEEERRRKIGLANKGKVPWNKGIKHTQG